MTSAELNALRLSEEEVDELRRREAGHAPGGLAWGLEPSARLRELRARRARVEAALREWWAQGCREVCPVCSSHDCSIWTEPLEVADVAGGLP